MQGLRVSFKLHVFYLERSPYEIHGRTDVLSAL